MSDLYTLLAEAYAKPSKTSQAIDAGFGAVDKGIKAYRDVQAQNEVDRQRKLRQMKLEDVLGNNTPDVLRGLSYEQADMSAKPLEAAAAFEKAKGNPSDYFNQAQTEAVSSGDPSKLSLAFGGKVPRTAVAANTSARGTNVKENFYNGANDIRRGQLQNSVLNTAMRYGGAGAAQKIIGDSQNRISNINRAKAIIDQIQSQNGQATSRQRAELAAATARTINPTGVMTNEALNLYIPQPLRGKIGNFQEYLANQSIPIDFNGFIPEFSNLLDRESEVNKTLVDSLGNQYSAPGIAQLNAINPGLAAKVKGSIPAAQTGGQVPPPSVSPQDQAALQWLHDNPSDPHANAVRAKLRTRNIN